MTAIQRDTYIQRAQETWHPKTEEIYIEDNAEVQSAQGVSGAWVQAWVFIPAQED